MVKDSRERHRLLGEVFAAEKNRFVRVVRRKLFDIAWTDAEDLVADVFMSVMRRGDFVGQIENLTAYLYRALANRITDHRRSPAASRRDDPLERVLEPVSVDLDPEELVERRQLRRRLRDALNQLSDLDRALWVETEINGRSFKDLAVEWQVPIGTLLSRKSRAGKTLRALLSDEGES